MKVKIEFRVELPDVPHTSKEVEEFLRFTYGDTGSLSGDNPFIEGPEPEPIMGTFYWSELR